MGMYDAEMMQDMDDELSQAHERLGRATSKVKTLQSQLDAAMHKETAMVLEIERERGRLDKTLCGVREGGVSVITCPVLGPILRIGDQEIPVINGDMLVFNSPVLAMEEREE